MSSFGDFCYAHYHDEHDETVFLFFKKHIVDDHHQYASADEMSPSVVLVSSGHPSTNPLVIGQKATQISVPADEGGRVYRLAAMIGGPKVDHNNNCGEQYLTVRVNQVDATRRLDLLRSFLTAKRREPEELQPREILCEHLRQQFPQEVATALMNHYDAFYKPNLTSIDSASVEGFLHLVLSVHAGDLPATSALAEFYLKKGDPRAEATLFDAIKAGEQAIANHPTAENYTDLGKAYRNLGGFYTQKNATLRPNDLDHADLYLAKAADCLKKGHDYIDLKDALVERSRILERIRSIDALKLSVQVLQEARTIAPRVIDEELLAVSIDQKYVLTQTPDSTQVVRIVTPADENPTIQTLRANEAGLSWAPLGVDAQTGRLLVQQGERTLLWLDPNRPDSTKYAGNARADAAVAANGLILAFKARPYDKPQEITVVKPDGSSYAPSRPTLQTSLDRADRVTGMAVAESGQRYAIAIRQAFPTMANLVDVYDASGTLIREIPADFFVQGLQLSADGNYLLGALSKNDPDELFLKAEDLSWAVWNVSTGAIVQLDFAAGKPQGAVSLAPDGSHVVISDSATGLLISDINGNQKEIVPLENLKPGSRLIHSWVSDRKLVVQEGPQPSKDPRDEQQSLSLYVVDWSGRKATELSINARSTAAGGWYFLNGSGNVQILASGEERTYNVYQVPDFRLVHSAKFYDHLPRALSEFVLLDDRFAVFPVGRQAYGYDLAGGVSNVIEIPVDEQSEEVRFRSVGESEKWTMCLEPTTSAIRGCYLYDGFTKIGFQALPTTNRVLRQDPQQPIAASASAGGSQFSVFYIPAQVFGGTLIDIPYPDKSLPASQDWAMYNLRGQWPPTPKKVRVPTDASWRYRPERYLESIHSGFLLDGRSSIAWQAVDPVDASGENPPQNLAKAPAAGLGVYDAHLAAGSSDGRSFLIEFYNPFSPKTVSTPVEFHLYDVSSAGTAEERKMPSGIAYNVSAWNQRFGNNPDASPQYTTNHSLDLKLLAFPSGDRTIIISLETGELQASVDLGAPEIIGQDFIIERIPGGSIEVWKFPKE